MGSTPPSPTDCPFCLSNNFFKGEVILDTAQAYLARNAFSPGNYLIIPKTHIEDPTELPNTWWKQVNELLAQIPGLGRNYNLSLNIGKQAGQTVKHLHFWIIPRHAGQPASGKGLAWLMREVNQL